MRTRDIRPERVLGLVLVGLIAGCLIGADELSEPPQFSAIALLPSEAASVFVELAERCDSADAQACAQLADALDRGLCLRLDPVASGQIAGQGCELGDVFACGALGRSRVMSLLVDQDLDLAVRLDQLGDAMPFLEETCMAGSPTACKFFLLSVRLVEGGESLNDHWDVILQIDAMDEEACDRGEASACLALGQRTIIHSQAEGRSRAAEYYGRGCELGSAQACVEQELLGGLDGFADAYTAEQLDLMAPFARASAILCRRHVSALACRHFAANVELGLVRSLTRDDDVVEIRALATELGYDRNCTDEEIPTRLGYAP